MCSRNRSSPVIAPPSVVATIFLRTPSTFPSKSLTFLRIGSPSGNAAVLWASAFRNATIRSNSALSSPNSAWTFIAASNCALRSASLNFARRSKPTVNFVSETFPPFVRRTVYTPGTRRGPRVPAKAICAAGGTRGGFARIAQVTRFRPGRLLAGNSSTTRPEESSTSSFNFPNRWRSR